MTNSKKSLATIKIVDAFGNPIAKAQYQVKNQKTGSVIAVGATNTAGCIVEISRDKGTVLDVYVKSMFNGVLLKVQTFTMSKDRMLVKIASPKVLLDLQTLQTQGTNGQYKRKTHIVKKGETLTSIASQNHTTVRALERLNKIEDPDKISVGQIIKLPVNIPATGSNAHHDKPTTKPASKPSTSSKPKTPSTQKPKTSQASTDVWGAISSIGGKVVDAVEDHVAELDKKYEEGKKALNEMVGSIKIPIHGDRSQEGGTPKTNATNLCKTNPQCIDKGNSELIREVNIRLAGFGGALPTDEFTELTAKCIKQFQRDYMGVPETGKICGSVLVALDKFSKEYPIDNYFNQMKCPCKSHGGGQECDGFGAGRTKQYYKDGKKGNFAIENKGMHRSVVWVFKAVCFYINKIDKKEFTINKIDSGYRCIENNDGHNGSNEKRTTINHMGLAFDIHFNKKGKRTREEADMNLIRSALFGHYMDGSTERRTNKIYLEPAWYGKKNGAITWVHFDFTRFEKYFLSDNFFAKTIEKLNGDSLCNLAKSSNADNILSCAGGFVVQPVETKLKQDAKLFDENDAKIALKVIYDTYGKDIAIIVEKMYRGETFHFRSGQYKYGGTPGMEVHGSAPYYGWDANLFTEAPIGTWSAYEGKGLSGVGGNAQDTKSKKVFVCVSSVLVGMNYVAKYIQKHNGNYARWFSTDASKQAVYRKHMGEIKAKIVPTFE